MPRTVVEPSPWLGTLAVRLPLDQLGDLYHAAHDEQTDPSTLVGRVLSEYLRNRHPTEAHLQAGAARE